MFIFKQTKRKAVSLCALTRITLLCLALTGCKSLEQFLFYPQQQLIATPADFGFRYDTVNIPSTDNVMLHCWYLHAEKPQIANVLFLHGNAENISTHMHSAAWLVKHGYGVLVLDYRGFGESTGHPDLNGLHNDALAALEWLRQKHAPIVIFGQSMGASVGLVVAATAEQQASPVQAVIAEAAPASWPQIAAEAMSRSVITWPLKWVAMRLDDTFDADQHIQEIHHTPILLVHSEDDHTIGPHHMEQLQASGPASTQTLKVRGPHIAAMRDGHVRAHILSFLSFITEAEVSNQNISPMPIDSTKLKKPCTFDQISCRDQE